MSEAEHFKSRRDFDNKYMSGFFRCCYCKELTANPYICTVCSKQANNLLSSDTYKYVIDDESEEVVQIFNPIEREEINDNDNDENRHSK